MADEGIATSTSPAWHDAQLQLAAQRHAVYVKTPDEVTASVAWLAGCVSAWKRAHGVVLRAGTQRSPH